MSYKRQTNFSPFNSKASATADQSKELRTLATALEARRKEDVKGFKVASNQQIEELGRGAKIQGANDQYEIEELARFSKSLNDALEVAGKTFGGKYIANQQAKGAEAYANDPIDPYEVNQEINELRDKNLDTLNDIEKEALKTKILSLDEKLKLHEARMKRGAFGNGYTRAFLQEVGNGFQTHLMSTTTDSQEWFQEPEINEETGEPIEGTGIAFKDYNGQDFDTKAEMESEILKRYKEKYNLDDINAKWLQKYVTEPANRVLTKWSANELQKSIMEDSVEKLEGFSREVSLDIAEFELLRIPPVVLEEGAPGYDEYQKYLQKRDGLQKNIQIFLKQVPIAYNNGGTPEGKTANQATSALLKSTLANSISKVDSDVGRQLLIDLVFDDFEFDTSVGRKKLTYFETFNKEDFELSVMVTRADNINKKKKAEETSMLADFEAAAKLYLVNNDKVALYEAYYTAKANPVFIIDSTLGNKIDTTFQSVLTKPASALPNKESLKKMEELAAFWDEIPISVALNAGINPKVIEQGQGSGIIAADDSVHWVFENKDDWSTMSLNIKNAYLDKLTGSKITNNDYNLINGAYIKAAESLSTEELIRRTKMYLKNTEWVEAQGTTDKNELFGLAANLAEKDILAEIEVISTAGEGSKELEASFLHGKSISGKQYGIKLVKGKDASFINESAWIDQTNNILTDNTRKLQEHVKGFLKTDETGTGVLSGDLISSNKDLNVEQKTILLEGNFEIVDGVKSYDNIPTVFVYAAQQDANGINALQIWNAERKTAGLGEISIDQLSPRLQKIMQFEGTLPKDQKIMIQEGNIDVVLDTNDLISVTYLTNAFKANNYEIPANQIKSYAKTLNIDYSDLFNNNGTRKEGTEVLFENIMRHHVNNLLKDATFGVNNKQEAIQNFHALANGQPKNHWVKNAQFEDLGVKFLENYNANGGNLSNYEEAYDITSDKELDFKYTDVEFMGKKYKQTGFGDMVIDTEAAKLNELNTEVIDSFDGDFSKIFKHNTKDLEVLSIEDLEQELNRAIEDTDGVDFDTRSRQNYKSASYQNYLNKISKIQSQINIIKLLQGGEGDIGWGLASNTADLNDGQAWLRAFFTPTAVAGLVPPVWTDDYRVLDDIKNVLSKTEFQTLRKQAATNAGLFAPPDSFTMSLVVPHIKSDMENKYMTEFYKLLIQHPKFYTGEIDGIK